MVLFYFPTQHIKRIQGGEVEAWKDGVLGRSSLILEEIQNFPMPTDWTFLPTAKQNHVCYFRDCIQLWVNTEILLQQLELIIPTNKLIVQKQRINHTTIFTNKNNAEDKLETKKKLAHTKNITP